MFAAFTPSLSDTIKAHCVPGHIVVGTDPPISQKMDAMYL